MEPRIHQRAEKSNPRRQHPWSWRHWMMSHLIPRVLRGAIALTVRISNAFQNRDSLLDLLTSDVESFNKSAFEIIDHIQTQCDGMCYARSVPDAKKKTNAFSIAPGYYWTARTALRNAIHTCHCYQSIVDRLNFAREQLERPSVISKSAHGNCVVLS